MHRIVTEVKTQLDAETGEERRWEEERVEVVIDLTGEHEEVAEVHYLPKTLPQHQG